MKKKTKRTTVKASHVVVIYGPPCSGKTRNAEALRDFYGCQHISDEAPMYQRDLRPGTIVLTNDEDYARQKFTYTEEVLEVFYLPIKAALKVMRGAKRLGFRRVAD